MSWGAEGNEEGPTVGGGTDHCSEGVGIFHWGWPMWVVEGGGYVLHHEAGWGRWIYGWVMAVHENPMSNCCSLVACSNESSSGGRG